MTKYIQGVIESMDGEYGVYYELKLRLLDGQVISIFYSNLRIIGPSPNKNHLKKIDPISAVLALEQFYELLIIVRAENFTYAPMAPEGTVLKLQSKEFPQIENSELVRRNDIRQGKILDTNWSPSGLPYRAVATPKIFERHYVLLETAIGQAVISRKIIEEHLREQVKEIKPGGYLEWLPARLDILAILQDEQPDEIQVFPL